MKYALWLSNVRGIGNQKIQYLLNKCSSSEEVYFTSQNALEKIYGIEEADVRNIIESKKNWNLEQEMVRLSEKGISFLSQEQEDYPKRLRCIIGAPYGIYYKGRLPDPKKKLAAIVGARGRSEYGSTVASELAKPLAEHEINIISGMARGIDSDGHIGCLQGDGTTYAVLGCGVDICYPYQNRYLYDQILEKGGIISEYPPGTMPRAPLFPPRNRIISAFSNYVIVVEARVKSGSLITADFAMEQGKEVYAVPGRVKDPLSQGCNYLIHEGAGVVLSAEELLKDWNVLGEEVCTQLDFKQSLMNEKELEIYTLLDFKPTGLGALIEKCPMSLEELLMVLQSMQKNGFIKETIPNYYCKIV